MPTKETLVVIAALVAPMGLAQDLARVPEGGRPRWFSFENQSGAKGAGGASNKGAKGDAWEPIPAGSARELMKVDGPGVLRRIWFTFRPWNQRMLRSTVLQIFWDHAAKPAVEAPLGDFFANGLAEPVAGQSALFSNPEGRSLNCYIPMPFRTGARVVLRNDAKEDVGLLFYDIDITKGDAIPADACYFHAYFHRDPLTALGKDYEILPRVGGRGRYLGATLGVQASPQYEDAGWGEGEVKVFLDGDRNLPTLAGTGTEDYIGTGWGMGPFTNQYQGCTVSDNKKRCWAFYRFHIPDPIYFDHDCRVTIQDIGGEGTEYVRRLKKAGAELVPVTSAADVPGFGRLLTDPNYPRLESPKFPLDSWVNFFRRDDYSSVAYFYLDRPTTDLPRLQSVKERTENLRY